MFQPVVLFIGLRYSRARQGSAFTAFINRFAFAGIALGVMALVVVMSVMNGFEGQLKERILGAVPQVTLTDADSTTELTNWRKTQEHLPELEAIKGSMPYVQTQGILQFSEKMSVANIQGIYPDVGEVPLSLEDKMVVGDWLSLTPGSYHLIIGQRLAQNKE